MKKNIRNILLAITLCISTVLPVNAASSQALITLEEKAFIEETGLLPGMVLVKKDIISLDNSYQIIEEFYVDDSQQKLRASQTKSASRTYTITNTSTGAVAIKFTLLGKFRYDGNTGVCTDAYVNVENNEPSNFSIVNESSTESGNTAIGYCYALFKKTGKQYGRTLKISISPLGEISFPN